MIIFFTDFSSILFERVFFLFLGLSHSHSLLLCQPIEDKNCNFFSQNTLSNLPPSLYTFTRPYLQARRRRRETAWPASHPFNQLTSKLVHSNRCQCASVTLGNMLHYATLCYTVWVGSPDSYRFLHWFQEKRRCRGRFTVFGPVAAYPIGSMYGIFTYICCHSCFMAPFWCYLWHIWQRLWAGLRKCHGSSLTSGLWKMDG